MMARIGTAVALIVIGIAVLLVGLAKAAVDTDAPLWQTGGFFWAGLALAAIGGGLAAPGSRQIRSARLANAGSVTAQHLRGDFAIQLAGRNQPLFEFNVDGAPVILRHNTVSMGGGDEWSLRLGPGRASLRSQSNDVLASATRKLGGRRRWQITDGFNRFDAIIKQEKKVSAAFQGRKVVRTRHLALCPPDLPDPIGTVKLAFSERVQAASGGHTHTAQFRGTICMNGPVAMPIAILALRLVAGRWTIRSPQTGTWHRSDHAPGP